MQNNDKAKQRFTAVVNFNSKLPQHVQDINILMVTSQWEGKGDARGRWRGTEVHKQCVWSREQVTEQESERVFVSVGEKKRERETVVMIDARLPPLCSSEWLQQKAQNNILTPCSAFFSLPASQLVDEGSAHSSAEAMLRLSPCRKQDLWLPSTS